MALTDIISEEVETSAPNMEVAQGGPEDFMTEDEMDPSNDPELQQLLDSLPGEQAQVLMQLIKEFKAMVAQGFQGEFEDFVKMKMSTAQGGPEEFMSEEEMIVPDEELQSMVPMGQQVAQGGRIGREMGGIMDVVEEEQVETGPTPQQLIMAWLEARGLPATPENIQKAILEMSREGQGPAMPREQSLMPQMEAPRPPTGEGYVPEELIGQTGAEVIEMGPQGEEAVFSDQEMIDMKQDYIDKGGTLDKASWGLEEDDETGIMQTTDPTFYSNDEETYTRDMFKDSTSTLLKGMYGAPDSREYLQNQMRDRINRYKRHNPDTTDEEIQEIIRGENYSISDLLRQQSAKGVPFNLAQGGRPGYGLGSLVKSVFKGAKKGVKGLVKSVKKFAKSDLGKAALMYMATAGLGNIGAAGGFGKASWASPFTKGAGTGWLRPGTVMGNLGKSWGNISKAFKGGPDISKAASDKLISSNVSPQLSQAMVGDASLAGKSKALFSSLASPTPDKTSFLAGLGKSFKGNPFPWIAGTSGAAGLYTAMNPGEDNLDNLMGNYAGEVGEWDQMLADIRAGKVQTPFSSDNTDFPYPDYMNLAAEGGRIGRAEGGLMNLGGLEKDYRAEGGFVPIGKKEKADDVPARLSVNEFVFTADAVRNAGGGDVDRGAEVMENVMTNLEQGGSISEESQGLEGAREMFEVSERLSEVV